MPLFDSSFASMLARTLFASTLRRTSCNTKPQRGVTMVASRFNGWYKAASYQPLKRLATIVRCLRHHMQNLNKINLITYLLTNKPHEPQGFSFYATASR